MSQNTDTTSDAQHRATVDRILGGGAPTASTGTPARRQRRARSPSRR